MKKLIEEFPNYEIDSNTLEVKSLGFPGTKYHKPRILKQVYDKSTGYYLVTLVDGAGVRKNRFIHRLLALTFIDNPLSKPQVNHVDGVKTNNKLSNLEWATSSENSQHAVDLGLTTYVGKPVEQLYNGEVINTFPSLQQAGRAVNTYPQNIYKVCTFKRNTAGGFGWRYV
jgi:hypothetical protein